MSNCSNPQMPIEIEWYVEQIKHIEFINININTTTVIDAIPSGQFIIGNPLCDAFVSFSIGGTKLRFTICFSHTIKIHHFFFKSHKALLWYGKNY